MAATDEWRGEMEAKQSLLAKQLDALQQHLGVPAADAEEVDQRLAEYTHNFWVTALFCAFVSSHYLV